MLPESTEKTNACKNPHADIHRDTGDIPGFSSVNPLLEATSDCWEGHWQELGNTNGSYIKNISQYRRYLFLLTNHVCEWLAKWNRSSVHNDKLENPDWPYLCK